MNEKIIIISGPTASGKTNYSINFAKENNGVIINADSMQIYKGLPILSAQPTEKEKGNVEHLLFSYLNSDETCNVGLWLQLVKEKIDYTISKGKTPIIVGGTGMYISKLINGISQIPEVSEVVRNKIQNLYNEIGYEEFYKKALKIDEEYTKKLNPNDKQRLMRVLEIYDVSGKSIKNFQDKGNILLYPREKFYHININPNRELLYKRCELRFNNMIKKDSAIEEIKNFIINNEKIINNLDKYSITKTIGLKEGIKYLNNEISLETFIEESIKITKNYAKRQYTWFNNQFEKFELRV